MIPLHGMTNDSPLSKAGASTMSRNALKLLIHSDKADPARLAMLRPSMVTIVNCMNMVQKMVSTQQSTTRAGAAQQVLDAIESETNLSVQCAVDALQSIYRNNSNPPQPLVLATFSRSSTLLAILQRVLAERPETIKLPILCSRSIPGGEGAIMAKDLNGNDSDTAICVEDDELKDLVTEGKVDALLIGADCVLADGSAVANKVGTAKLASAACQSTCRVVCCTDRLKVWDDAFPPPLETDLFEMVPVKDHDLKLLLPSPTIATME